jgi:hypothetical protein
MAMNGGLTGMLTAVSNDLRGSPALLSVAILNVLVIGMLFFLVREAAHRYDKQFNFILSHCSTLKGD